MSFAKRSATPMFCHVEPISEIERLPLRLDGSLQTVFGVDGATIELRFPAGDGLPTLRCDLPRAVRSAVSVILRVHSRAGIPLAWAAATIDAGARSFDTPPVRLLAMEGYAHLKDPQRRGVERRVLARRSYVAATAA